MANHVGLQLDAKRQKQAKEEQNASARQRIVLALEQEAQHSQWDFDLRRKAFNRAAKKDQLDAMMKHLEDPDLPPEDRAQMTKEKLALVRELSLTRQEVPDPPLTVAFGQKTPARSPATSTGSPTSAITTDDSNNVASVASV